MITLKLTELRVGGGHVRIDGFKPITGPFESKTHMEAVLTAMAAKYGCQEVLISYRPGMGPNIELVTINIEGYVIAKYILTVTP